jgi:F-type H+-transporting ATPase subunit epsilon
MLNISLVSPTHLAFEGQADHVYMPAYEGKIGIFPGHSSFMFRLKPGIVEVASTTRTQYFFIEGGFAQIDSNYLRVLAKQVTEMKDLSPQEIRIKMEALQQEIEGVSDQNWPQYQSLNDHYQALLEVVKILDHN